MPYSGCGSTFKSVLTLLNNGAGEVPSALFGHWPTPLHVLCTTNTEREKESGLVTGIGWEVNEALS